MRCPNEMIIQKVLRNEILGILFFSDQRLVCISFSFVFLVVLVSFVHPEFVIDQEVGGCLRTESLWLCPCPLKHTAPIRSPGNTNTEHDLCSLYSKKELAARLLSKLCSRTPALLIELPSLQAKLQNRLNEWQTCKSYPKEDKHALPMMHTPSLHN